MVQYEIVLELREFLSEHVYTCFYTHYYFEHAGKRLNDYQELAELSLESGDRIFMRPGKTPDIPDNDADKYDEKSARQHIKRVKDILNTPPVLSAQTDAAGP